MFWTYFLFWSWKQPQQYPWKPLGASYLQKICLKCLFFIVINSNLRATSIGLVVILTTLVAEGLRFESWGALLLYSLVL
jgi:hypothetical protein